MSFCDATSLLLRLGECCIMQSTRAPVPLAGLQARYHLFMQAALDWVRIWVWKSCGAHCVSSCTSELRHDTARFALVPLCNQGKHGLGAFGFVARASARNLQTLSSGRWLLPGLRFRAALGQDSCREEHQAAGPRSLGSVGFKV